MAREILSSSNHFDYLNNFDYICFQARCVLHRKTGFVLFKKNIQA